jgi:hypothetical protein
MQVAARKSGALSAKRSLLWDMIGATQSSNIGREPSITNNLYERQVISIIIAIVVCKCKLVGV